MKCNNTHCKYYEPAEFGNLIELLLKKDGDANMHTVRKEEKVSKMTKEEIIKIVNENAVPVFPLQIEYQDWLTAMDMVIEAFDKQIPKKPIYNDYGYNGFDEFPPNCAKCPNCGREIPYGIWNYEDSHHCECGQALDWGEENK